MGMFSDLGRVMKGASTLPRTSLAQSIRMTAESLEQMPAWQATAQAAQTGYGAATADPFANFTMGQAAVRTSATVVDLTPTAQRVDAATVFEVTLSIADPEGGVPWRVEHRQLIAPAALGNWQPGRIMPVRFDPQQRDSIMIG